MLHSDPVNPKKTEIIILDGNDDPELLIAEAVLQQKWKEQGFTEEEIAKWGPKEKWNRIRRALSLPESTSQ